jgi:glycosyltransferase involved in cell wall biosynthesis
MDLSIVIPVYNEQESLPELLDWITRILADSGIRYEILMVDDGSSDNSWQVIKDLSKKHITVRAIRFRRNYGKAAALQNGFEISTGDVVITMDADLQDNPEEIPELYSMIHDQHYDLVSGWKRKRYDPITKILPSRLYNRTVRMISGIKIHDFNCGLKAYRLDVVKSIELYGEMHRYVPVLAKKAGFLRIGEKVVQHQKRKYGVSKYGYKRFMTGFLDLLSILFLSRFGKKPMHFFGSLGTIMFIAGFMAAAWLGAEKIYFTLNHILKVRVTESPYFYIALAAMIIGSQLFLAGFLGEMITRNSSDRNKYLIAEKIN